MWAYEVKVPAKCKNRTAYKLQQVHETYKYREKVIREFVVKKESEGFKLTRKTIKQFFDALECFANSVETNSTFCDIHDECRKNRPGVCGPIDEDDVKLQGQWCCSKNRPECMGFGEKGT